MKNVLKVSMLSFVLMSVMASSFSLLKVGGTYTGFGKGSGIGAMVDFPLFPFIPTVLNITSVGETDVVANLTYGGKTFSGTKKFSSLALDFQAKIPLVNMSGFEFGGDVLVDLLTGKSNDGTAVALPGGVYAGVFGQYNQNFLPLVDGFVQLGYFAKIYDAQKALADSATSVGTLDLSGSDRSGLFYRVGVSIGL